LTKPEPAYSKTRERVNETIKYQSDPIIEAFVAIIALLKVALTTDKMSGEVGAWRVGVRYESIPEAGPFFSGLKFLPDGSLIPD